jgi:hypothetical protein
MAQPNPNNKIIVNAVDALQLIDKTFSELIAEFGAISVLKPADSYLLGVLRTAQTSCNYAYSFAQDLDRASKAISKRPIDPNLKPDTD